jgi:hypothetical protein
VKCGSKAACAESHQPTIWCCSIRHDKRAKHRRRPRDKVARRRGSDARRCGRTACAKQAVHETANVRGLDPAACSASNTGLDGCWRCLPSTQPTLVHATQARALHSVPYQTAAAFINALHQGTKPKRRSMPDTWSSHSPCSSSRCSD